MRYMLLCMAAILPFQPIFSINVNKGYELVPLDPECFLHLIPDELIHKIVFDQLDPKERAHVFSLLNMTSKVLRKKLKRLDPKLISRLYIEYFYALKTRKCPLFYAVESENNHMIDVFIKSKEDFSCHEKDCSLLIFEKLKTKSSKTLLKKIRSLPHGYYGDVEANYKEFKKDKNHFQCESRIGLIVDLGIQTILSGYCFYSYGRLLDGYTVENCTLKLDEDGKNMIISSCAFFGIPYVVKLMNGVYRCYFHWRLKKHAKYFISSRKKNIYWATCIGSNCFALLCYTVALSLTYTAGGHISNETTFRDCLQDNGYNYNPRKPVFFPIFMGGFLWALTVLIASVGCGRYCYYNGGFNGFC